MRCHICCYGVQCCAAEFYSLEKIIIIPPFVFNPIITLLKIIVAILLL